MYSTYVSTRYVQNTYNPRKVQLRLQHALRFAQSGLPRNEPGSRTKESLKKATYIPESTCSHRWETSTPTPPQLLRAQRFFLRHPPVLLYSSTKFRTVESSSAPEVAFLGRSNVGKSSLLNALLGKNICHTSSKPGRTRSMNFFAVGGEDQSGNPGKVVVLDMPGYGEGSREEWGPEIMKYLVGRRQLRRAFVLVDTQHGLKHSDEVLLKELRRNGVSHQVILSKVDRILLPGSRTPSISSLHQYTLKLDEIYQNIRAKIQPGKLDGPEALGEIISCSATKSLERGRRPGINQVRWAILAATGLNIPNRTFRETNVTEGRTTSDDDEIPSGRSHVPTVRYIPNGHQAETLAANGLNIPSRTFRATNFTEDRTTPEEDEISSGRSHVRPVRYVPYRHQAETLAA